MPSLTVPPPVLVLDPPAGPPALEKPVTVVLSGLAYPDALAVAPNEARGIGALIYRGVGGSEEVWDEANGTWVAAPVDEGAIAALAPLPFAPPTTPGGPWIGTLIAVGQEDATGNPRFEKAVVGVPAYRLRAVATAVRDGEAFSGISGPTGDLLFISSTEQQRFAVEFDTGQASDAGRARLFLKNAALQPAGYVEIRAAGGQEIEIANCTWSGTPLARMTLSSDGDIHLTPASGRRIVLEAPLEAEEITYQPQGGGPRQTL
jgi:hypothetical protein